MYSFSLISVTLQRLGLPTLCISSGWGSVNIILCECWVIVWPRLSGQHSYEQQQQMGERSFYLLPLELFAVEYSVNVFLISFMLGPLPTMLYFSYTKKAYQPNVVLSMFLCVYVGSWATANAFVACARGRAGRLGPYSVSNMCILYRVSYRIISDVINNIVCHIIYIYTFCSLRKE